MAGTSYTRQSTLTDGDTITAGLFNNEYNQIVSAFSYTTSGTTGHQHDGSAGQGGNIHTIGDQDFLNKIVVDTANNRVGFFIEVSGTATEQIRVEDGAVVPVTDNDVDLGSSSVQFKDLFLNGTANIDALVLTSGSTVTTILNEDNMSSDSDTALATQQSIKAYVDAQVTAQDLDLTDGTTVIAIDLDSETLSILGGTGITSTASGNGVTLAIDGTVTTLTGTQTLTNKTIDADNNTIQNLEVDNLKSGVLDTDISSVSSSDDTLPSAKAVKTYVDAQVTAQDLDFQGDSGGALNIDLDSETLTVAGGTGIDTSGATNTLTVAIDSTVATLTGTQTLTNKTLTSPDINTPDIDGGTIDNTVIGGSTAAAGSFTTVDATGNITVAGTVDGRDVATDGAKLDAIEASATADQTADEIRTLVESATDSNVFTDADHSKLNAIESGATADQTAAEIKTAYESNSDTNAFTDADHTKLDGIEASATADQTDAEIRAAVEAATDSNVFTDADHSKLNAIEASADVTDTANVTSAGALMDSELTAIASVKALNQGVATTDSPTFVNLTLSGTGSVKVPSGTTAQRDGSPANGMFRYNSTNEQFEGYQSGAWGAIGGGGGSNTFTADTFTGNGSTTAYALSQVVNSEDNLLVFIAGVFQQQSAYSIATASGTTTLTFATAPANTREIIVYSVASAVSGTNLNIDSMTGDGSDTTLSLTINPVNENNTQVFIDGVYQNKDTYSISGTTLTFSTAPPTGSAVEVMTMTQTEINVPVDGTITPAKIASGDFYFNNNLLVGKSSSSLTTAGVELFADGKSFFTRSSANAVAYFNKEDNDGSILEFRKDGSTVGSASTLGGDFIVGSSSGSGAAFRMDGTNNQIYPSNATGSARDNAVNLGASTVRWKDLYLSGGAYLGGTGAANKLDDYEEGVWIPTFGSSSLGTGLNYSDAKYVKIGSLVHCTVDITFTGGSGNVTTAMAFLISGLPFTVENTATGTMWGSTNFSGGIRNTGMLMGLSSSIYGGFEYAGGVSKTTGLALALTYKTA